MLTYHGHVDPMLILGAQYPHVCQHCIEIFKIFIIIACCLLGFEPPNQIVVGAHPQEPREPYGYPSLIFTP